MSILSLDKQHQDLQIVIDQLNAEMKNPSDNRRRRPRKEINIALWVYLLGLRHMPRVKVHSRDISVGGISFLSKRSFPERMLVATQLDTSGLMPRKMLLTKIRFCRYVRGGHFQVGAEFIEAIDGQASDIPTHWIEHASQGIALEALMKN